MKQRRLHKRIYKGREASKRDSVTVKGLGRNWDALVKGSLATAEVENRVLRWRSGGGANWSGGAGGVRAPNCRMERWGMVKFAKP